MDRSAVLAKGRGEGDDSKAGVELSESGWALELKFQSMVMYVKYSASMGFDPGV